MAFSTLEIRRQGEDYHFSLRRRGAPTAGAMHSDWPVRVAGNIVQALNRTILEAIKTANAIPCPPDAAHNPFVEAGSNLYRQFLPPALNDLRKELRRLRTPLLIMTNEPGVCWELLYDEAKGKIKGKGKANDKGKDEGKDEKFLGLTHCLGRCLIKGTSKPAPPRGERDWRCLMNCQLPARQEARLSSSGCGGGAVAAQMAARAKC